MIIQKKKNTLDKSNETKGKSSSEKRLLRRPITKPTEKGNLLEIEIYIFIVNRYFYLFILVPISREPTHHRKGKGGTAVIDWFGTCC